MQEQLGDLEIEIDIVGQQYFQPAVVLSQFVFMVVRFDDGFGRHESDTALEPGGKPEDAATIEFAVDAYFATHQFGQFHGDGQAQASTAVFTGGRGVGLLEELEQATEFFRGEADPGVFDFKTQHQVVLVFFQQTCAQGHFAVFGEFDGVGSVVEQRLTQAGGIASQPARYGVEVDNDWQALFASLIGDHCANVVEDRFEVEIDFVKLHFFRFDLGEIENVVDQFKQVGGGAFDLDQAIELSGRRVAGAQQMGEADDGVHRRADFMAHIGQEGTFRHVGGVGLNPRFGQLCRAPVDFVFEVETVVVEFFTEAFFLGDVFLDRDVVRDRSVGLFDRGNRCEFDEQGSILAFVVKLALPRLAAP